MITIINYGLGNIMAFRNIYDNLNINVKVASTYKDLVDAKKIILPGVGSFDWAMLKLNNSGMRDLLDELVLVKKVDVLGVCVGMQIMANKSEEGELPGLKWFEDEVRLLSSNEDSSSSSSLPHMGWNNLEFTRQHPLFNGFDDWNFYFLHSYYFNSVNKDYIISKTDYGLKFPSSIFKQNIHGVQFHPEKSHKWGIKLLENFYKL